MDVGRWNDPSLSSSSSFSSSQPATTIALRTSSLAARPSSSTIPINAIDNCNNDHHRRHRHQHHDDDWRQQYADLRSSRYQDGTGLVAGSERTPGLGAGTASSIGDDDGDGYHTNRPLQLSHPEPRRHLHHQHQQQQLPCIIDGQQQQQPYHQTFHQRYPVAPATGGVPAIAPTAPFTTASAPLGPSSSYHPPNTPKPLDEVYDSLDRKRRQHQQLLHHHRHNTGGGGGGGSSFNAGISRGLGGLRPCKFGLNCRDVKCPYAHTDQQQQQQVHQVHVSRHRYENSGEGDGDYQYEQHNINSGSSKFDRLCKFGPSCRDDKCLYLHQQQRNFCHPQDEIAAITTGWQQQQHPNVTGLRGRPSGLPAHRYHQQHHSNPHPQNNYRHPKRRTACQHGVYCDYYPGKCKFYHPIARLIDLNPNDVDGRHRLIEEQKKLDQYEKEELDRERRERERQERERRHYHRQDDNNTNDNRPYQHRLQEGEPPLPPPETDSSPPGRYYNKQGEHGQSERHYQIRSGPVAAAAINTSLLFAQGRDHTRTRGRHLDEGVGEHNQQADLYGSLEQYLRSSVIDDTTNQQQEQSYSNNELDFLLRDIDIVVTNNGNDIGAYSKMTGDRDPAAGQSTSTAADATAGGDGSGSDSRCRSDIENRTTISTTASKTNTNQEEETTTTSVAASANAITTSSENGEGNVDSIPHAANSSQHPQRDDPTHTVPVTTVAVTPDGTESSIGGRGERPGGSDKNHERPSCTQAVAGNGSGSGSSNASVTTSASEREGRKVFIGGLPMDITQPEFYSFFAQFGEVIDAIVMFDRETGRSRGFGFVTYSDPEVAHWVIRQGSVVDGVGRLEMRGKVCEIKLATPRSTAPASVPAVGGSRRNNYRRDFRDAYNHHHLPPHYRDYPTDPRQYYAGGGNGVYAVPSTYGYGGYSPTSSYMGLAGVSEYGGVSYQHQGYSSSQPPSIHQGAMYGDQQLQYIHPHAVATMQLYPPGATMTPEEASMMLSFGGPPQFSVHPGTAGYSSVMKMEAPGLPTKSSSAQSTPPSLDDTEASDDGQGSGNKADNRKEHVGTVQRSFEQLHIGVDR